MPQPRRDLLSQVPKLIHAHALLLSIGFLASGGHALAEPKLPCLNLEAFYKQVARLPARYRVRVQVTDIRIPGSGVSGEFRRTVLRFRNRSYVLPVRNFRPNPIQGDCRSLAWEGGRGPRKILSSTPTKLVLSDGSSTETIEVLEKSRLIRLKSSRDEKFTRWPCGKGAKVESEVHRVITEELVTFGDPLPPPEKPSPELARMIAESAVPRTQDHSEDGCEPEPPAETMPLPEPAIRGESPVIQPLPR